VTSEFIITEGDIDRELDALLEKKSKRQKKIDKLNSLRGSLDKAVNNINSADSEEEKQKISRNLDIYEKQANKGLFPDGRKEVLAKIEKLRCLLKGGKWEDGKCIFPDGEENGEDDKEEKAEIIIPDLESTAGGARFIGGLSSVGDPITKQIRDFTEDLPVIARYGFQFSTLIRVFATLKMIQAPSVVARKTAAEKAAEAEKAADKKAALAGLDKEIEGEWTAATAKKKALEPDAIKKRAAERVAKKRAWASERDPTSRTGATLQEAVSAEMLKDIENQFKEYLKGPVTKALKDTISAEEFSVKFVAGEVKKLKAAKAQVDQSASLSRAYNKTTDYGKLTDELMIKLANVLKNNLDIIIDNLPEKEESEEEESVTEPTETEETGAGDESTLIQVNEDKLTEIVIDFNEIRKNELNESFLTMFGSWIKHILGAMLGGFNIPVSVRGSKNEVESFARAVGSEKSYIETAKRYGLDHPTTYKSQAKLRTATKGFEKETGIKWPFK